jgi:hypothetical protein
MEASQILNQAVEEGKRDVTGAVGATGAESSVGNIKETAAKVPPTSPVSFFSFECHLSLIY